MRHLFDRPRWERATPTLAPYQSKRTADANEAARWLLNQTPSSSIYTPASQIVLQKLSVAPDATGPKELTNALTNFGNMFQAGTMYVSLGDQRPAPSPADASAPPFRSNIASRGKLPFVGREDIIGQLDALLIDTHTECVAALHGAPGVGKSELAREFARLRRGRYKGGTFAIDASKNAFALELASLGEKVLAFTFPAEKFDDRGKRTFLAATREPVLLIYDNVVSFDQVDSGCRIAECRVTFSLPRCWIGLPTCGRVWRLSRSLRRNRLNSPRGCQAGRCGGAVRRNARGWPSGCAARFL